MEFQWKQYPEAENFIQQVIEKAAAANEEIADLKERLHRETSTRLFDWVDHLILGKEEHLDRRLESMGYEGEEAASAYRIFRNAGAQLPMIQVRDQGQPILGIAVKVERIEDFLMVRGMAGKVEGSTFSAYRRALVSTEKGVSLWVVERRATHTMEPVVKDAAYLQRYLASVERWKTRPRAMEDEDEAIEITIKIAQELVDSMGKDVASWIVLGCERDYWQSKNRAGQIQKNRQDHLGMGWANHDHHTFRSSRRHFMQLVRLFEVLGFHCRERFYAGEEAGWGAQVMENSSSGLVLFLDVDLLPEELEIDFAHHQLPEIEHLGTIGLWCALHGDSILKAGMHHLEAQFEHHLLTEDLAKAGIGMMEPFSNFDYLKQAFTQGEMWRVDPRRLDKLVSLKRIGPEQAEHFKTEGALGSHLENLQRRNGYKGFNQKNVSFIIKKTDPRLVKS